MTATLTFHGGAGEIGGNCIEVTTPGSRTFLDFGISFKRYGQAFDEFMTPRRVAGIGDWLHAGVAPELQGIYRPDYLQQAGLPQGIPEDVHVILSHPHLDHMGLVPFLHKDAHIHASPTAMGIANAIQGTGGSFNEEDYTSYTPRYKFRENAKGGLSKSDKRYEETTPRNWHTDARQDLGNDLDLELVTVDHSIHGARGAILSGAASIAYSGDLRCHGRHKEETERWAEKAGGSDVLLIEGTTIHHDHDASRVVDSDHRLLDDFKGIEDDTEQGVEDYLYEHLNAETGYAFTAYPQRDLDRLESMLRASRRAGRRLCLTLKQAFLLDSLQQDLSKALDHPIPLISDPDVRIYAPRKGWGLLESKNPSEQALGESEYQAWERPFLAQSNTVFREDILADPGKYVVFADIWNLTEFHEFQPQGGTYIHSKTEPFNEEMTIDRKRLLWWLDRWNLKPVAAHVSGHAPWNHLDWLIDEVGAKTVVPIHTENPEGYGKLLESQGIKHFAPKLGQTHSI